MSTLEIRDGDGVERHLKTIGDGDVTTPYQPLQVQREFSHAIATGEVAGSSRFCGHAEKAINSVDAADLWGGAADIQPIPASSGIQLQFVSTSANDTAGGTGIRTIEAHFILADGSEAIENITMNGVTPVLTSNTDIQFINIAHAETVGTGKLAAGDITIESVGGATEFSKIATNFNQTMSTLRMVPSGKRLLITDFNASELLDKKATVRLLTTSHSGALTSDVFLCKHSTFVKANSISRSINPPINVPAGGIVKVGVWTSQAVEVEANWSGYLEAV